MDQYHLCQILIVLKSVENEIGHGDLAKGLLTRLMLLEVSETAMRVEVDQTNYTLKSGKLVVSRQVFPIVVPFAPCNKNYTERVSDAIRQHNGEV